MDPTELAHEMAAARQRREEKTARQIREARAQAIRAAMPPGSARAAIEERARNFYPRLSAELIEQAVALVYVETRNSGGQQSELEPRPVLTDLAAIGEVVELVEIPELAEMAEIAEIAEISDLNEIEIAEIR